MRRHGIIIEFKKRKKQQSPHPNLNPMSSPSTQHEPTTEMSDTGSPPPSSSSPRDQTHPSPSSPPPAMSLSDFTTSENINDKELRKTIRRKRITRRNTVFLQKSPNDKGLIPRRKSPPLTKLLSDKQTERSRCYLDSRKAAGIDKVTAVRGDVERREHERRMEEDERRRERMEASRRERDETEELLKDVNENWATIITTTAENGSECCCRTPQSLHDAVQKQKDRCAGVLHRKNELIHQFRDSLKRKDDEYIKSLALQTADVDAVRELMKRNLTTMQNAYDVEFDAIEESVVDDFDALVRRHEEENRSLTRKKRAVAEERLRAAELRRRENRMEVEDIRRKGEDHLQSLKVTLEGKVQELQHQLVDMRATYFLQRDKLDYNFQDVEKREAECTDVIKKQKKRVVQSKAHLTRAREAATTSEIVEKRKNDALRADCERIERQIENLRSTLGHFTTADKAKFRAVWGMEEEEVSELVEKVLSIGKLIDEDILGLPVTAIDVFNHSRPLVKEDHNDDKENTNAIEEEKNDGGLVRKHVDDNDGIVQTKHRDGQQLHHEVPPWIKNCNTIPRDTYEKWNRLEQIMLGYKEVLERRSRGTDAIETLQQQNYQLMEKLKSLTESQINDELIVPPTTFIMQQQPHSDDCDASFMGSTF